MSLKETLSTIPTNFNLCKRCHLKRLSTIPQIPIYTKGVSSRDIFYNSKKLDLYLKVTIDRGCVVESVSWLSV